MYLVPINEYGNGTFAMDVVKEVKVTEEYLKLDEDTRNCQNTETFEECTTKQYLSAVEKKCKCIPNCLKKFADKNQVFQIENFHAKCEFLSQCHM